MFNRDIRARHRQLMAELSAMEARDEGIEAAHVVSPPRDKLSMGKAVVFLAGLGAVAYLFAFSKKSPFDLFGEGEDDKNPSKQNEDESRKIIDQIRYGQMEDAERASTEKP